MYINLIPGQNGIKYATATTSKRTGKKVTKDKDQSIYLGRVLDEKRMIFKNRTDGVFVFDLKTMKKLPAPADFVPGIKRKNAHAPELYLDFGDTFFLDKYIEKLGLYTLVDGIDYGNPDRLKALLMFYMLSKAKNCHAQLWWEGSYARVLFPKADLSSQRISEMLEEIGTEAKCQRFFKSYIPFVKTLSASLKPSADSKSGPKEPESACGFNVLIDSTGLPNSIRFPITAVSNHNGKISEEVRLIYVVQQKTGLPIYMRYVPGNVIDSTTLVTTLKELKAQGVETRYAILDAGYVTDENLKAMAENKISYLSRLPENRKVFKDLLAKYGDTLTEEKNMVQYGDRLLYLQRFEREIVPGIKSYVYLGLDTAEKHMLQKQAVHKANVNKSTIGRLKKQLKNLGVFCLVSSRPIATKNLLPLYYTRQDVEQVFDIAKGYASLTPLSVQKEETFRGHLLMTFVSTVVLRMTQQQDSETSLDELFLTLRNQKCKIFARDAIPQEASKKQNDIYKKFKITVPKSIAVPAPAVD